MPQVSPHDPQTRLLALLRLERRDLGYLLIYAVCTGLLFLVVPIAVQALVNTAGFGNLLQPLVILAGLVFVGLGFSGALMAVQTHLVEHIQRRLFARVAADLAYRLPRVRLEAFDRQHAPELVNRFFDVLTLQKSGAVLLLDGLATVVQSVIGLALMALYHPVLLGYDLLLIAGLAGIVFVLGAGASRTAITESKAKYAVAAWLEEITRHPTAFRTPGGLALALGHTDALLVRYMGYRRAHFRVLFRQIIGAVSLQALASGLLLGIGGWLVLQRQLSLGQLVAAEFIVAMMAAAFAKLGKQLEAYYDLLAAADKVGQLIDLPLEESGPSALEDTHRPMAIRLRGVTLGHPGAEPLLAGVDLAIAPGEHVCVTGPHGAGKSTLLDLLYGLRRPDEGIVELDGRTVRELDRASLRGQVELVREIEVFEGSVMDNVRMGRDDVDEARAREALALMGLQDAVNGLPRGVHTPLATGGAPLSPGQARLLTLARAVAARPRLLLLDEALAQYEDQVRLRLLDVLFAPDAPWTLVAVTYSPDAIDRSDRVFDLAHGQLMERAPGEGAR